MRERERERDRGSYYIILYYTDVNDWNVDDVCSWLSEIGFSEYVEDIVTHNITGPELMEMRTEDMQVPFYI